MPCTCNLWRPWCLLALVCLGCGSGSRQAIEGTVTLDGQPLANGEITFIPEEGTKGPTAGAEIVDGKFAIPTARGTFAGKFRVEITASRVGNQKVVGHLRGETGYAYEQFIPSKYNNASQLKADVNADAENHFDFAVTSK